MGKWSQQRRRGGARAYGTLLAPVQPEWTLTQGASGCIVFTRLVDIPAGATHTLARTRQVGTTTWTTLSPFTAPAYSHCGLTPGQEWEGQISWSKGPLRLSEFSNTNTIEVPA